MPSTACVFAQANNNNNNNNIIEIILIIILRKLKQLNRWLTAPKGATPAN